MKQIAKNSTEYWARRKAEFVVSQLDKAENTAEIMKQTYAKAQKHLVDQADKIFLKYQRDYKLSETQARAILKRSGVDVMKLKRELQNGVQSDEIKQILTDMDSAAYASRIEKLIQSQKDIDNLMLGMSKNDNKLLTNHLKNIADDSYLHEMFMLQKRAKVAFEFGSLDPEYVDKLLHVNWSGKHFSNAIWNNHAELGQTLKEEYLVNYLTGRSSFDMAKVIEERFGVEGYKARRLVRTESTFFSAELEAKAYEEAGIEQYEYVSVLDDRTTSICKSKDGKIYNVKDRRAGVNYPPLHVFCRATTIAHIPNEWLKEVDGDVFDDTLGYKEWKKSHQPQKNEDKEKVVDPIIKQNSIAFIENSNFKEVYGEENYNNFIKHLSEVQDERVHKIFSFLNNEKYFEFAKKGGDYFDGFNVSLTESSFSGDRVSRPFETIYHEIAHASDGKRIKNYMLTFEERKKGTYIDGKGKNAVEVPYYINTFSEFEKYNLKQKIKDDLWNYVTRGNFSQWEDKIPSFKNKKWGVFKEWNERKNFYFQEFENEFIEMKKERPYLVNIISDIYEGSGFSRNEYPFGVGHGFSYWKKPHRSNQEAEFFAEVTQIIAMGDKEEYNLLEKVFPNAVKTYNEMVDDLYEFKKGVK